MTIQVSDRPSTIPVIDIAPLISGQGDISAVADSIHQACCETGFFYIIGHGVDIALQQQLEQLSRQFFAQDLDTKLQIKMALAGRAWRGYFPMGDELTSGKPDRKEGIYFGEELDETYPAVQAGVLMHGKNLFPDLPQFRETVLDYMNAMTRLGHTLMSGIALSLGLDASYFHDRYTANPFVLFRIFNYPADPNPQSAEWGVGEHTDYGLLTILKQDDAGGLQVKSKAGWIDAPPTSNAFVCNIGDMLDRLTGGYYRSTPHRVRNLSERDRLSFPFFFDPNFSALVQPIEFNRPAVEDDKTNRWDRSSVHEFHGTYGDYILGKVAKVFPELREKVV